MWTIILGIALMLPAIIWLWVLLPQLFYLILAVVGLIVGAGIICTKLDERFI